MRPVVVSSTTGRSQTVVLDSNSGPWVAGYQVAISGTPTFNVEYSLDDPFASGGVVNWNAQESAKTAALAGALNVPARAMCVNVTSGTGTATLTVVQSSND